MRGHDDLLLAAGWIAGDQVLAGPACFGLLEGEIICAALAPYDGLWMLFSEFGAVKEPVDSQERTISAGLGQRMPQVEIPNNGCQARDA